MYYSSENQYRQNPIESLKGFFRNKNVLIRLIVINVLVWLAVMFLSVWFDLFKTDGIGEVLNWFSVPADINQLLTRPWTVLTYMFLHYDFWHILFNMLWLYWFGQIFLEFLLPRQLLATYIFGGLAGAAFYIISFNLFPKFEDIYEQSVALGASASVMAIVVAISFYVPAKQINLLFIGPVRIIYIALISIVLDVLMIKSSNSGGHLAHLGGALWGFFSVWMLRRQIDVSSLFGKFSLSGLKKLFKRRKRTGFRKVHSNPRPKTDEEYNFERKLNQEKIDEILDKISKSGYDSLTKPEKEFLFKTSRKGK